MAFPLAAPPALETDRGKKIPNSFKNFGKKSGETGGARTRDHKLKRLVKACDSLWYLGDLYKSYPFRLAF